MRKYWLPRCTTEGSSRLLRVMKSGSLFFRAAAAPAAEFNACPPMEINYRSQLGRFTCDEWARLWWVGENEVSLASLALGNQPPPPLSSAQTQMHSLTLSLYIRRVRYAKIICYPRAAPRAPLSCFAWELALTLKADKVAGLFGLPSDDAQAVLQAQYALHAEMRRLAFLTGTFIWFQIKSRQV